MPMKTEKRYFRRPNGELITVFETTVVRGGREHEPDWITEDGRIVTCDSEGAFCLGDERLIEVKP